MDFFEQLREKPESQRRKILIFTTAFFMCIVFMVWFSTANYSLDVSDKDSVELDRQLKPVDEIKNSASSLVDTVKTFSKNLYQGATTTKNR